MAATLRVTAGNITMVFLYEHPECQGLSAAGVDGMPGGGNTLCHCQKTAHSVRRQTGQQHPFATILETHLQIVGPRGNRKKLPRPAIGFRDNHFTIISVFCISDDNLGRDGIPFEKHFPIDTERGIGIVEIPQPDGIHPDIKIIEKITIPATRCIGLNRCCDIRYRGADFHRPEHPALQNHVGCLKNVFAQTVPVQPVNRIAERPIATGGNATTRTRRTRLTEGNRPGGNQVVLDFTIRRPFRCIEPLHRRPAEACIGITLNNNITRRRRHQNNTVPILILEIRGDTFLRFVEDTIAVPVHPALEVAVITGD